eukprot:Clim_evm2s161 gene=Clim_evmTU2s161
MARNDKTWTGRVDSSVNTLEQSLKDAVGELNKWASVLDEKDSKEYEKLCQQMAQIECMIEKYVAEVDDKISAEETMMDETKMLAQVASKQIKQLKGFVQDTERQLVQVQAEKAQLEAAMNMAPMA